MSEVIFDEDKTLRYSLEPKVKIPTKGFEGWFYRTFPGEYYFKKTILLGVIILLFCIALVFIALGQFNIQKERIDFEDRSNSKQT